MKEGTEETEGMKRKRTEGRMHTGRKQKKQGR